MLKEFRDFAVRGNAIDMAVGIIIGAAFGAVVTSLVQDMIMPPIGWLIGKVGFSDMFVNLTGDSYPSLQAAKDAGAPVIGYGSFITTGINFLIVSFAVFMLVRWINRLRAMVVEEETKAPEVPAQEALLAEIRDLLKSQTR